MKDNVDVVIVSWNCSDLLFDCLVSLEKFRENVGAVFVVDNASEDDFEGFLNKINGFSIKVTVVRNEKNNGFAKACNQGAALCSSENILFLNPDTTVFPRSLSVPLDFLKSEQAKNVGIVGVQLLDAKNEVARSCSRFPTVKNFFAQSIGLNRLWVYRHFSSAMHEWDHLESRIVDQVIGAFFLVRTSLFRQLKGFDERFFVYFEEVDFAFRAKLIGWDSYYLATAQAYHEGGGTSSQVKAHRLFYSLRSRLLYGIKHFSVFDVIALFVVTLVLEPLSRVLFAGLKGRFSDVKNTLKGFGMLYCDLPAILRKARTL
ncbi:glycosyltransferase family 2 protein [Vogesella indigofera]|uniref:glycosyltransferase family 2 protein n=1 Tax=Vogesella indigofera TaxID=45465 RepID=UPI003F4326BC